MRRLGLLPYAKRLAALVSRQTPYFVKLAIEQANYHDVEAVHELPPSHDYWANKHLLPTLRAYGFSRPEEFFANYIQRCLQSGGENRVFSVGAGNCDMEVRVAALLEARGAGDFVIECLDINPAMLERGRALAAKQGVLARLAFTQGDFNAWAPAQPYCAVMANQALHHVLELEHLFDAIAVAIGAQGRLIVSDMIGRNGHRRWPEALAMVQEFWRELPPTHRYNRQMNRREDSFQDWDHSSSGFEGVRAQDILPLLVRRLRFEMLLPFGNLIDPFIDRAYGFNFDPRQDWDRGFLDRVHEKDEQEIAAGRIKPTHMFAVLSRRGLAEPQLWNGLRPEDCIRVP